MKPLLLQIQQDDLDKIIVREGKGFSTDSLSVISRYDELLLDIICLGIHNQKTDPPGWFREVLKRQQYLGRHRHPIKCHFIQARL